MAEILFSEDIPDRLDGEFRVVLTGNDNHPVLSVTIPEWFLHF